MTYRLFFAIWPDSRIQKQIERVLSRYEWPRNTKFILPQNWHVTLNFLGSSTEIEYQNLVTQIPFIEIPSFILTLDKLEYWPKQQLLMLVPSLIPSPLIDLHKKISQLLIKQNWTIEKRDYEPHLTLARNLSSDYVLQKMELGPLDFPLECWVREFCLADTSLRDAGKMQNYQILKHWKLN